MPCKPDFVKKYHNLDKSRSNSPLPEYFRCVVRAVLGIRLLDRMCNGENVLVELKRLIIVAWVACGAREAVRAAVDAVNAVPPLMPASEDGRTRGRTDCAS